MKARGRVLTAFSVLIFGACMIWFIVSGAVVLAKKGAVSPERAQKGDVCEFTAVFADEAFEIKNSVNFIPTGKEHYYLVASEDGIVRFLVRAKPSWIEQRFDSDGFAKGNGVKISGVVTRMDYEFKKDISEINGQLIKSGVITASETLNTSYYIDARYKEFGRLRIFSGIGVIVIGVLLRLGMISGVLRSNKLIKAVLGAVTIAVSLLLIYTVSVGGVGI